MAGGPAKMAGGLPKNTLTGPAKTQEVR